MVTALVQGPENSISRLGVVVQAVLLGGVLAGAGLLAIIMAGSSYRGDGPLREDPPGLHDSPSNERPVVVVEPAQDLLVVVLVDGSGDEDAYNELAMRMAAQIPELKGRLQIEAVVMRNDADRQALEAAQHHAADVGWFEDVAQLYLLDMRGR